MLGNVQVNYINAHATSTLVGDIAEVRAVKSAFPDMSRMKINGTKSMIGHCLGAAGGMEAIATLKAIQTGWVHPTLNQVSMPLAHVQSVVLSACVVHTRTRRRCLQSLARLVPNHGNHVNGCAVSCVPVIADVSVNMAGNRGWQGGQRALKGFLPHRGGDRG